ncbi:MAG: hypothetical protein SGJ18_09915 [Pseudomonadota bacterium]|nr:hypothetical protein [Pseudomonadota bacterium]
MKLNLVLIVCFFSFVASAARPKAYSFKQYLAEVQRPVAIAEADYPYFDEKMSATIKPQLDIEAQRKPAQMSELQESNMSPDAQEVIKSIAAIDVSDENPKATDELDNLINLYLDKKYATLSPDAKLIVSQLRSLKPFRGFLWRFRPYLDQARITQTAALTSFKNLAANLRWLLRSPQAKLAFRYVSEPYAEGDVLAPAIDSEGKIQYWLASEVLPAFSKTAKMLHEIPVDSAKPLVWDNRLLMGPESFKDGIDRFKWTGEVEKQLLIASYENSISQILFFNSYSIYNLLELSVDLGKLFGVDSLPIPFTEAQGVTMAQYQSVIMKSKYEEFGKKISGCTYANKACMEMSFKYLKSATERTYDVWKIAQRRDGNNFFALNTEYAQVDIARGNINFENIKSLVNRKTMLRSLATGEVAVFDLRAFYMPNPPADLKALLPTGFDNTKDREKSIQLGKLTKTESYRNFFFGSPLTWKSVEPYKSFLPNVTSGSDVLQAGRVLAHATAGIVRIPGLTLAEQ